MANADSQAFQQWTGNAFTEIRAGVALVCVFNVGFSGFLEHSRQYQLA